MDSESAPPLGLLIAIWSVLFASVALACAPVILCLILIAGAL